MPQAEGRVRETNCRAGEIGSVLAKRRMTCEGYTSTMVSARGDGCKRKNFLPQTL
ncbi:MAG: hypothetical protein AAF316_10660 [Cyanobacteria bacterium P01_A01_bin.80]